MERILTIIDCLIRNLKKYQEEINRDENAKQDQMFHEFPKNPNVKAHEDIY